MTLQSQTVSRYEYVALASPFFIFRSGFQLTINTFSRKSKKVLLNVFRCLE